MSETILQDSRTICKEALDRFVERGVDLNAMLRGRFFPETILTYCIYMGWHRAVEILCKHPHIDINRSNGSRLTPLMVAVQSNNYRAIQILGQCEDLNLSSSPLFSPLHEAALHDCGEAYIALVQLLESAGIPRPDRLVNAYGMRPSSMWPSAGRCKFIINPPAPDLILDSVHDQSRVCHNG